MMTENESPKQFNELQVKLVHEYKMGEKLYSVKQDENITLYVISSNTVRKVGDLNELFKRKESLDAEIKHEETIIPQAETGKNDPLYNANIIRVKRHKKNIELLREELKNIEERIEQMYETFNDDRDGKRLETLKKNYGPQTSKLQFGRRRNITKNSKTVGGNSKRPRRTYKMKNSKRKTRKSKRKN